MESAKVGENILNKTIGGIIAGTPKEEDRFFQYYWCGDDGKEVALVVATGENASNSLKDAVRAISDDEHITSPQVLIVSQETRDKARRILEDLKHSNPTPMHEDVRIIMACLKDVVDGWNDLFQYSESSEVMAASLSNRRDRSSAYVFASLMRLLRTSGISMQQIVREMKMRPENVSLIEELKKALEAS